jgi:two-component system sensor histidine kinase QseC
MIVRRTLRWRLMLVIGSCLAGLWLLLAPWLLHSVRTEMEKSLDNRLAASAQMVASLVNRQQLLNASDEANDRSDTVSDMASTKPVQPNFPSSLACRVSTLRGDVLALSQDAPTRVLEEAPDGYSIEEVEGQRWRVYTTTVNNLRITTADRVSTRDSLMASVVIAAVVPFLIALAGALVATWFGIQRAFCPLKELTYSVGQREDHDLDPLQWSGTPAEVKPLVDEINRLLARAQEAVRRERRFTGDAAHELRTPLTAIKTQLQVAKLTSGDESRHSLTQAERAVGKLQSTLEQLLLLARLDGNAVLDEAVRVSADEISAEAIRCVAALAHQRNININYRAAAPLVVEAPAALAITALRNLLHNAVRHSPDGGQVTLTFQVTGDEGIWTVRDQGPGVPAEKLQQLTERFIHLTPGGSGLGLAIADAIAKRFRGALTLDNGEPGGLVARLHLPVESVHPTSNRPTT